jgi:hypothetical protein
MFELEFEDRARRALLRAGAILACIAVLAGCGTVPGSPPTTGYKGDAVWNISRVGPGTTA